MEAAKTGKWLFENWLALTAVIISVLSFWHSWGQSRSSARRNERERKHLLWMFVYEAVELQRRWAQYCEQALHNQISFSLPYEWTTPEMVNKLIHLGESQSAIKAIYRVKRLGDIKPATA